MQPRLEDLRKKAYMLYGGPEGVKRVQKQIGKVGVREDDMTEEQVKKAMNLIIKHVFIDFVGLEKSKLVLSKPVTHIPGYTPPEEPILEDKISLLERFKFTKMLVIILAIATLGLLVGISYYTLTFDKTVACDVKKDVNSRDQCYLTVALTKYNASVCDKLSTLEQTYSCYNSVGVHLNDTSICKLIPKDDVNLMALHDKCLTCIAFNLNNISMCRDFISPQKELECESQIERGYSLLCGA